MGPCGLKKLVVPILLLVLLIGGAVYWAQRQWEPEVATVAASTLEALQQQNRLLVLSNNSSATVTTTQTRFGLSAKKTLIVQGLTRYEVDMAKLTANDVRWDAETETLSVRIPPIKIPPPQIDLNSIQEYGEAGILRSLTNVDDTLDASNRAKAQAELIKQAQSPVLMDLARAAAKKAVAQNFEVPLRAAGIDAKIAPFFDGETDKTVTTRWDVSTPLREAIGK
jgi:Protein of unknown function (DUF4230)